MIKIPLCFVPEFLLELLFPFFQPISNFLDNNVFPNFSLTLKQARIDVPSKKYLGFCFISDLIVSLFVFILMELFFLKVKVERVNPTFFSLLIAVMIFFFFFFQQIGYPKILIKKRVDNIERNLLPALQTILVQLRSGIPLFDVLVNVASSDYGEMSREFMGVVKMINGGVHQIEALEKLAIDNPSPLLRSVVWQMINGMKTGAELSDVLKNIMNSVIEQEFLQIEQYGAVLSPLTMFYMIGAVILPALGVNFLIVLVSFMKLGKNITMLVFWSTFGFVLFFQFMFINIIKSKRPNLLAD